MMIQLIAHRGFWLEPAEKNTEVAFSRALQHGFGIETDFRDCDGQLVVSHDVPKRGAMTAAAFAELFKSCPASAPMALNVKADGLQQLMADFIAASGISDGFVFDMAVPDMRAYLSSGIPVFTRLSEFETLPALLDRSAGVWLDAFESEWYDDVLIRALLENGKRVAIVSPELHHRPHEALWRFLKDKQLHRSAAVSICTDLPMDAREYFHA